MATTKKPTPSPQPAAQEPHTGDPVFLIQRVYLKELSLEQPNSPAILLETQQPELDVRLSLDSQAIAEGIYEVAVTATVLTKVREKTMFLVEAKQAAIFEIRNIPAEQISPILGITCPQIVYPYLRASIADTIVRAGFAPVHLSEINFQAMYEQQQTQLAQGLSSAESANDAT